VETPTLFTIGHSNQSEEQLLELLRQHQIEILIDVRSVPYSRYSPQHNRESLEVSVPEAGIRYVYAGDYLGGRPNEASCYDANGLIDYRVVQEQGFYKIGISRLIDYARSTRVAIMCSEEDPNRCHRHKLIARTLIQRGFEVRHIRGDGRLETATALPQQVKMFG
jgi:uncharacterized protein (DUF488 family)